MDNKTPLTIQPQVASLSPGVGKPGELVYWEQK